MDASAQERQWGNLIALRVAMGLCIAAAAKSAAEKDGTTVGRQMADMHDAVLDQIRRYTIADGAARSETIRACAESAADEIFGVLNRNLPAG